MISNFSPINFTSTYRFDFKIASKTNENFTEEKYEIIKRMFEKYVKLEKEKERLEKIKKDFVWLYYLKMMKLTTW